MILLEFSPSENHLFKWMQRAECGADCRFSSKIREVITTWRGMLLKNHARFLKKGRLLLAESKLGSWENQIKFLWRVKKVFVESCKDLYEDFFLFPRRLFCVIVKREKRFHWKLFSLTLRRCFTHRAWRLGCSQKPIASTRRDSIVVTRSRRVVLPMQG